MRFLLPLLICTSCGVAQSALDAQRFYEDILKTPPSAEVAIEKLNALLTPALNGTPTDAAHVLAAIQPALKHPSHYVQLAATAGLIMLTQRPDSAALFTATPKLLEDFVDQRNPQLEDGALFLLTYLRPTPPPEILPPLLRLAAAQGTPDRTRAMALLAALQQTQWSRRLQKPSEIETILPRLEALLKSTADPNVRIRIIDGATLLQREMPGHSRLVAMPVNALRDPAASVRTRALYNLMQLGPQVLRPVSLDIERLRTQDPDPEVRAEADKALRVMAGEPQFPR